MFKTASSKIVLVIILLLLTGTIFFGIKYYSTQKQLQETQDSLSAQQINEEILEFTKFFIDEVLQSETEVDFETRLELENAVRDLGDEEIFNQWEKFVGSETEEQAQAEVKQLLELLMQKIQG